LPTKGETEAQGVKCRPLRRRYIVFRVAGEASDSDIVGAVTGPSCERGMTRLVLREGPYAVVRMDHIAAARAEARAPTRLANGGAEMRSVSTTGSIAKAREKIKKLLRRDIAGDEEAVPVKQNDKMLIK